MDAVRILTGLSARLKIFHLETPFRPKQRPHLDPIIDPI